MEDRRYIKTINRARRGNSEAFRELIDMKARNIIYIATRMMGNKADGEDAAQEAIIEISRCIKNLTKPERFDSWVYRIVYNVCMDEKKKKMRLKGLEEPVEFETAASTAPELNKDLLPELSMERDFEQQRIMAAIENLPDKYRICILLFHFEGLSYAEIADALSISEDSVAVILFRGREKLKSLLGPQAEDGKTAVGARTGASAALPLSAITQAMFLDAGSTVLPGAVEGVKGAVFSKLAAMKGTSLKEVFATTAAKTAAVVSTGAVAAACGAFAVYGGGAPEPDADAVVVAPPVKTEQVIQQPDEPVVEAAPREETGPSAEVIRQPDGAASQAILKGSAEWEQLEERIDELTYIGTATSGGYDCEIYLDESNGEECFYVVIDGDIDSLEGPLYLDVGLR